MRKIWATLALAAAFIPSSLLARDAEHRFTRDGVTYVYTIAPTKTGRHVIEGHRLPGGSAFRLVVSGNRVDGTAGGYPVAFRMPATAVQVAAR